MVLSEEYNTAYKALREAAADCPACILASLRQSDTVIPEFNFATEMKEVWDVVNDANYIGGGMGP